MQAQQPQKPSLAKRIWHFLWEEDSILSWLANVILAFILIKFIVYPGLGLILGTSFPVVAVVSPSMEHDWKFDDWWGYQGRWYEEQGITKATFSSFPFKKGFNKGDIMVLYGTKPEKLEIGEVIVFQTEFRTEPIIHRIVAKTENAHFQTKGDKNPVTHSFEQDISPEQIYGKAVFRIPLLGYVKVGFMEVINLVR